jgi:predicted ArsR family transcriptional regulator
MNMSTSNTSATQKLLKYLQSGYDITAAQARSRFGITNVSARISELRQAGFAVYLNEKTTKSGYTIKAYRLGTPTRRMVAVANFVMSNPSKFSGLLSSVDSTLETAGVASR